MNYLQLKAVYCGEKVNYSFNIFCLFLDVFFIFFYVFFPGISFSVFVLLFFRFTFD